MRALFLLPCALACTPEGASLEPWHGQDDGAPFLGDDVQQRFDRVTRTYGEPGEARLVHDGPILRARDEVWLWNNELTVVEAADDLRVAWEGGGVQLLLWLPRIDLVDAVAFPTVAVGQPGAHSDIPGVGQVEVPAGIEVDLAQSEGDHVFVEYEAWSPHSSALVSAWVHLGDIDQAWFRGKRSGAHSGYDAWVEGPILDRPHGDVLAVSANEEHLVVDVAGDREDGWAPVHWSNGETTIDGWVYEDDLTLIGGMTGGWGVGCSSCCVGFGWGGSSHDVVPANTPIRADRDGPIVARTTRQLVVPGFDDGGAWHTVDTPWGAAELWVDPLDMPQSETAD